MNGLLTKLKIKDTIYKFRKEEDVYYTYIPLIGKFVEFNEVAFQIIMYINKGICKEEIIDKFSNQYKEIDRKIFVNYISDFFIELENYKMI